MANKVPLPPPEATVKTTACEYCPVACGYKVYTWPLEEEGGPAAADNALGRTFPLDEPGGGWPSPAMHNVVQIDSRAHNVLILPDRDTEVVNVAGNHSVRGGALAQKLYNVDLPTSDRLGVPLLRVEGELKPILWDAATDIVAALSRHVVDTHGPLAWGMKRYSYGGHENVTAITKLALGAIGSPNHAPHHAPAAGDDVPGLSDAGIDAFSACFEDDREADVLLIIGTDPYETKTVRFLEWMVPGEAELIVVDPRKTFSSVFAAGRGGQHLQLKMGTDVALLGAIARIIVEEGWEDRAFIDEHVATAEQIAAEPSWRRARFGRGFEELRTWLLEEEDFAFPRAETLTGVSEQAAREAAARLTGAGEARPKVTVLFEKGLYWTHNYENTAAVANLALLLGSVGRPGRAISRLGGHQRGGQSGAGYPLEASPHDFEGHPIHMDADRWFVEGKTRLMWNIGVNWIGAAACSTAIEAALAELTQGTVSSTDPETVIEELKARMDAGGTVFVYQDIYPNESMAYADLVLPAAAWGEKDFARHNAERRLRLYQKFMDAPGLARDDWEIVAEVATKMGYEGFDWPNANALFEEAAERSAGSRRDFAAIVEKARAEGVRAHDLLAAMGTTGIQAPIRLEEGELVGTPRLHTDLVFKTASGKANFVFADQAAVAARNEALAPGSDEMWVTNVRVNHLWNNLSDFTRRPNAIRRWPGNFLELNPQDAEALGVSSGDRLRVQNDAVPDQTGAPVEGGFEAVAYVTDVVPPGLAATYFQYPGSYANSVVSGDATLQPLGARYSFKMGRGRVTRLGGPDPELAMPFVPRNLPLKEDPEDV